MRRAACCLQHAATTVPSHRHPKRIRGPFMNSNRRHFLGMAATTLAATRLGVVGNAITTAGRLLGASSDLRQIDAGVLNVGYLEAGPSDGAPVLLLHGWPYDIHS